MIPRLYGSKEKTFEHNGIGVLINTVSCLVTEEQNGMYELELTYTVGSFLCNLIVEDNIIKAKANEEHNPQLFRIFWVSEEINGTIIAKAEHISYDLRGNFLENIMLANVTCQEAGTQMLAKLEEKHNFTFNSDIEMTSNYNITRHNGLESIAGSRGSLLDTFGNGAKLVRDNFNISLVNSRGRSNNVLISYAKNMTGYKRELDLTDLVTKIYPFAIVQTDIGTEDNPQTIEETLVLPERFINSLNYDKYANGKILALDYSSEESIKDIASLRNVANKYFKDTKQDEPNINYAVEFFNLYGTTEYDSLNLRELEKVCMDDTVIVRDFRYGRNVEARVIKTLYNTLLERYEKIELGKFKESLKLTDPDLNEKVEANINKIRNIYTRFSVMDDKIESEVFKLEGDIKTHSTLIQQTAESIIQAAKDIEGNTSLINQTASNIRREVSSTTSGLQSSINQNAGNITNLVKDTNGRFTEINQKVDRIDITGLVSFNDLSSPSSRTEIYGGHIKTNSIEGDSIRAKTLSIDRLTSTNESNACIDLFSMCRLDARSGAIRLQWDSYSYFFVNDRSLEGYLDGGQLFNFRIDSSYIYTGLNTEHISPLSRDHYNCGSINNYWRYTCCYNLRYNNYSESITRMNNVNMSDFFKNYSELSNPINARNKMIEGEGDNKATRYNEVFLLNQENESFVDGAKLSYMQSKCLEELVKENETLKNRLFSIEERLSLLEKR